MSWIPKDEKFFELFDRAADNMVKMVEAFSDFVNHFGDDSTDALLSRIHDLEHEGDILTHDVMDKLNRSFITPIDREDIQALTKAIDDVVDLVQAAADRMVMYKIDKATDSLKDMVEVLILSVKETAKAVQSIKQLEETRRVLDYCIEISRYENEGDALLRKTVTKLFDHAKDPIQLIKWKEIYENVEIALDKCENVANVIEGIVVKNA